jgi:hypothetical protein
LVLGMPQQLIADAFTVMIVAIDLGCVKTRLSQ